jgi:hypothetical protein
VTPPDFYLSYGSCTPFVGSLTALSMSSLFQPCLSVLRVALFVVLEGGVLMRKPMNRRWWLALVALLCMFPGAYAAKPDQGPYATKLDRAGRCGEHGKGRNCQQVPEGGSAAVYLLGAGITCLGAMFIRSRASRPSLS